MPKRSRFIRHCEESKALKKLRIESSISQRELAKIMNVPQTKVAHAENGRAYIRKKYIGEFLDALGLSFEDWDKLISVKDSASDKREECIFILNNISEDKIELVRDLLLNLAEVKSFNPFMRSSRVV